MKAWCRAAVTGALAGALAFSAEPARAHLIPAKQGTVNVVGAAVFTVVSVPVAALQRVDADDNHDGVIDVHELDRHEAALRAEIDRRLAIFDGATEARTVRVDLILSPQHDSAGDRADQIVALKHAVLDAPPADLRVRCDLFAAGEPHGELKITATRHPASGTETEIAVLRPDATEHAFFPRPAPQPASAGGWTALGALAAAVMALAGGARRRRRDIDAA